MISLLEDWSFAELQQMISYKAARERQWLASPRRIAAPEFSRGVSTHGGCE
jgi:hypothetical protein